VAIVKASLSELINTADFLKVMVFESTTECFYCYGELQEVDGKKYKAPPGEHELFCVDNIVYWRGSGFVLLLHADCAKELGCHLIKDGLLAATELDRRDARPRRQVVPKDGNG
jgi:hypothetical protein